MIHTKFMKLIIYTLTVAIMFPIVVYTSMVLWNTCLVDAIDGVNSISFWQTAGIYTLTLFMFRSNVIKNNMIKHDE